LFAATPLAFSQELNVLIIGSTRSFSEGGESGVVQEKPFNPSPMATHLQSILAQDPAITDAVHVEFEDIYKTKTQTVNYSGSSTYEFTSRCYSLAQHYLWPEGKADRLANLRGEGARVWDSIVLCHDPYIMANFPGMVAEGVKLIRDEVAKSANPAQIILLAQWPENSSTFTANQFNEIAYRVGNSAGLAVVPAGKAWDSYTPQDTSSAHPTARGGYLAAAAIYSQLFNRSAKTSGYAFAEDGSAIADHALSVVQANAGVAQYSGKYTSINPFQMKHVTKRVVSYRETGTSTEDRIAQALGRLDDVHRISFNTTGYAGVPGTRWDFNYGRGNDWWEDDKDYEVAPLKYDRSYGFPMHHYTTASAPVTMPYGIDKHYSPIYGYEDGTDLGIAYNMIRPGTRELSLPEDVRAIPIRLMWQKMTEISPGFNPLGDSTHMHPNLNDATASFMYTLLSGRCPVVEEPATPGSTAWMQWLGHKIGYETAWQMSQLTTRSPGFKVLPASVSATSVTPTTTTTLTVQFMNPPQSDVRVSTSISNAGAAIVGPKTLIFTPANYQTPQQVTVAGIPGAAASDAFEVVFNTHSDDEIYDGLGDSWSYSTTRSSTVGVTQVDRGTTAATTTQTTPVSINPNAAGANAGNTTLIGPLYGSVAWTGAGLIEYTPDPSYLGPDEIAYAATVAGTQTIGTIAISVDVLDGQVDVESGDATASEEGPDSGTFVITRAGDTGSALEVFFTLGGTATLGDDYTLSHTSPATIPSGQRSVTLTLTPVDDSTFVEGQETASLTLSPDPAYPIGNATATITIFDNDNRPPVVDAGTDQVISTGGSTVWSPSPTTTALWLDASDAGSITLTGTTVSEWRDKSVNKRNASQATAANQPTLTAAALNGKPVLTFDGSTDFMAIDLDFLAGVSHSAFIVTKPTVFSNLFGAANGSQAANSLHVGFNGNNYRMNFWANDFGPVRSGNFIAESANLVNYAWVTGTGKQIFANGKSEGSNTNAGTIGTMSGGGRIGRTTGHPFFGGDIAEMIFLTGTVATAEREMMEGYLAHKWGLTAHLPAAHPYKATAPGGTSATAQLDGTVTDPDGGTPAVLWTQVSGPGVVTFANPSAIDTSAAFSLPGTYLLRLTADDSQDQTFAEITITVTEQAAYSQWIGGFSELGGLTAFADDADGDHIKNGVEAFFGTPPNAPNAGLAATDFTGNALTFTHPEADAPLADVTGSYEWSLDLASWHASGVQANGTTVTFTAARNTPGAGTTSVTATLTGTETAWLFVRVVVSQN